jgi:hypothetical protein
MGRPLKIRKQSSGGVNIDQGFPNDGTTDNGYDGNQPGVVGGTQGGNSNYSEQIQIQARILTKANGTITTVSGNATVTGSSTNFDTQALNSGNSQIVVDDGNGGYTVVGVVDAVASATSLTLVANAAAVLSGSNYYYSTETNSGAHILRQKGAKKFLVCTELSLQDEAIAQGQAYKIRTLSDTDWVALGAPENATAGVVFTATKSGHGLTTNGTVYPVGVCTLVDDSTPPGQNEMSIAVYNDGDTTYAAKITNHWVRDFDNNSYPPNDSDVKFVATFFNDNGDDDPATGYRIVGIENFC